MDSPPDNSSYLWELNSGNMERYPFFSFSPEPSFVAFLDPNVSPYSQISPPGLPGFRSKCLSVCWIKLKPRNCFEYEKAALTLERDGSQDKTELRTSSTLNSVNIQRKFHNFSFLCFSCSDIGGNIFDILNIHSNKRSTGRKY